MKRPRSRRCTGCGVTVPVRKARVENWVCFQAKDEGGPDEWFCFECALAELQLVPVSRRRVDRG
jgi:hypothetical protein